MLGQGVLQDNISGHTFYANMWFNVAALLRNERASKNREMIAGRTISADICLKSYRIFMSTSLRLSRISFASISLF